MDKCARLRTAEIDREIYSIKKQISDADGIIGYRRLDFVINKLGELTFERNKLTGENNDLKYLFLDDGEGFSGIIGIVGEDTAYTDINGVSLKIGDTVGYKCEDGSVYPRIVVLSIMNQKVINEYSAEKLKDYSEMDISDSFCASFTISVNSCLQKYEMALKESEITQ